MSDHMENPPAGDPRGTHVMAVNHPQSTAHPADLLARAARHDYGLRVTWERADGRICTQTYASLSTAERKVQRTRERGFRAHMQLVQIVPVHFTPEEVAW